MSGPPTTDSPRRQRLLAASIWLFACVVLGLLNTAEQLKAPMRAILSGLVRALFPGLG